LLVDFIFKLMQRNILYLIIGLLTVLSCDAPDYPQTYPLILTQPADNITSAGARFNGKFESIGSDQKIMDYGFVWNMQSNPTIYNSSRLSLGSTPTHDFFGMATEGMIAGKTYYVKSYVITDRVTIYGPAVDFKSEGSPTSWKKISDTTPLGNAAGVSPVVYNGMIYCLYGNLFYSYDVTANTWTAKANFPGGSRIGASAFTINGTLYYGFGKYTGEFSTSYYKDIFAYDPVADTWTTVMASASVATRSSAVTFVIGSKAFIGFGEGPTALNDFYEFDPFAVSFKSIPTSLQNVKSANASSFVLNGKGYLVGVEKPGSQTSPSADVYEFDPAALTFSKKADFPNTLIATNNIASATTGYVFSQPPFNFNNKIYGYDQVKNVWTANEIFPGTGRYLATTAFVNGKIYFGNGFSVISQNGPPKPTPDLWELTVK